VRGTRSLLAAVGLALGAAPAGAPALEPRFDHRDSHGPFAEALLAHDTVARSSEPTASRWHTGLRAGWGFDVSGEGNELFFGAIVAVPWPDDPDRTHMLFAVDARYRGYFGTEQLKTFFEVGVWAPLRSRLAIGPLAGLGLAWDFGRGGGAYVSGTFATAFGEARFASFVLTAGAQVRFDLP
jgi:hypothetical protein